MSISRARAWVYPIAAIALGANSATAQDFPGKPIRIITTSAGGGNDFVARLIGPAISGSLSQPVIVDNRPPVNAAEAVAKARHDRASGRATH